MKGYRVLVTGGAGFVGSHLCERLLFDGHHVTAIDDMSTGSWSNVRHLEDHPRFAMIEHDVTEPFDVPAVDRVFNLACPASPAAYQRDPVKTNLTSVLGALHGLELAERRGARFLQASTSEVYGDPEVHPQPEGYLGHVNPIGVRACYDEGKRCAEALAADFQRARGVDVRIARIFNTYGPRMRPDDGRVISSFIVQSLCGEALSVHGDGSQTRSFCYVDDLVSGLVLLMEHVRPPGPVNLGNPEEFTVLELAHKILKLTGSTSRIRHVPLPPDDPKVRRPAIDRARRLLRFEPRVMLDEGLAQTIASFRNARIEGRGLIAAAG